MSLARKFLSKRFSKSFKEFNLREEEQRQQRRESAAAADQEAAGEDLGQPHGATWSSILPELLGEIIGHLEATEDRVERRKYVIACAGVCKRWREITKEVHNCHLNRGMITFPSCLKRPGPSDLYHQCLIKRNMRTSTFYLYLALSPSLTDKGKFLLAARRYRRPSHVEYIISLQAHDYSQGSNAYLGKLCSDFLGTNFTIYDSEPPHNGARALSTKGSRRFASKQISPQLSSGNFEVGQVSYKFNILKSRGPRRMVCNLKSLNSSSSSSGQTSTKPVTPINENPKMKHSESSLGTESMVLKNKAPKWHEPLQCWCLNFHGRVTQASVKNFQLVSAVEGDDETVLLQFGKVDTHLFTMDFRQPLSAFQAFGICLTTFGSKLACE